MNTLENFAVTEDDFQNWNAKMRGLAISYLENQGIKSPQIGDWPAFEVAPKFGIWCVESQKVKGKIGWWIFAGDCPIDYVPRMANAILGQHSKICSGDGKLTCFT